MNTKRTRNLWLVQAVVITTFDYDTFYWITWWGNKRLVGSFRERQIQRAV